MKKIFAVVMAAIITLCSTITSYAEFDKGYVNTYKLNCRTEPTTDSSIITTFPIETEVQIIGANGRWLQVYDGQVQGWCYGSYINVNSSGAEEGSPKINGKYLGNFKISYYTCAASENGGWNVTAKGQRLTDVTGVCIAADPNVIPYYSKVYIEGVGYRTVLDCGGAIRGNRIDVLVQGNSEIPSCGIHYSNVYLVE